MPPASAELSRYVTKALSAPLLSKDEEYSLAYAWIERQDPAARDRLVETHLRLVCSMALRFVRHGASFEDLISEGSLGLLRAVDRFDPKFGYRLSTYAMWWIRAFMFDYIIADYSIVRFKPNHAERKLLLQIRRLKAQHGVESLGELPSEQVEAIATELGMGVAPLRKVDDHFSRRDLSLDALTTPNGDSYLESLPSSDPTPFDLLDEQRTQEMRTQAIHRHLDWLAENTRFSARNREIFEERAISDDPRTLRDLGHAIGLTAERIRQIEEKTYRYLAERILTHESAAALAL